MRSRHGHTAFRTKARLLGWLSACSLVGQTLGHITSPSASSGFSPATPLPPGCWVLLCLRQAVHGFIGYKSLFSPAHQKKKKTSQFLGRCILKDRVYCLLLACIFSVYSLPSKDERRSAQHARITCLNHCMLCSFGFHKE